ncbi:L-rhamnose mutarotase [Reichenbachiella versicolor]|uniref:L-rhamnose mutarotase n=1 Tax=Reichenbachiella versicolor TaxID=1821036 RepID=UPI000D6DF82B|nr:L-rhamnose mutarotase [Reichenbachiella versicolor]
MSTQRFCLALDLKDDPELIAKYEEYHAPGNAWPEITESITSAGITDMQIYRTGNRLFMIMEVDETFDPTKKAEMDANNPKVQEWEELMNTFQLPIPWAAPGEKWVPMNKIFQL